MGKSKNKKNKETVNKGSPPASRTRSRTANSTVMESTSEEQDHGNIFRHLGAGDGVDSDDDVSHDGVAGVPTPRPTAAAAQPTTMLHPDTTRDELNPEAQKAIMRSARAPDCTGGNEYDDYKDNMESHLDLFGLKSFIAEDPDTIDEARRASPQWRKASTQVYRIILKSLGDDHALLALGCDENDAYSIWTTIAKRVAAGARAREMEMLDGISTITMESSETLDEFLTKFERLRLRLHRGRLRLSAANLIAYLYRALPERYQTRMDGIPGDLSYVEVVDRLRVFAAMNKRGDTPSAMTLMTGTTFSGTCYNCRQPGHKASTCPTPPRATSTTTRPVCSYCAKIGHTEDKCRLKTAVDMPVDQLNELLAKRGLRAMAIGTAASPPPAPAPPASTAAPTPVVTVTTAPDAGPAHYHEGLYHLHPAGPPHHSSVI